jgi:holo-[acyl-carrier protein] synthase
MIAGIGTDLVDVERMAERLEKKSGFREMVFSADEILYCEARAFKYEHYAARFAAKEAFLKALGTGWAKGTAFNEIEICNDAEGKPEFRFHGITAETVATLGFEKVFVSLSHTKTMATAMVVIER